jgi:hypothetical protein
MTDTTTKSELLERNAHFVRGQIPKSGLFAGLDWRISPTPFPLGENLAEEIESLGRVLLQFYRAVNLLYRQAALRANSRRGLQNCWIAANRRELIELSSASPAFSKTMCRASSGPTFAADGNRHQHHGTGFRARRHRADRRG